MEEIKILLAENPLLLLFTVIGLGYSIGRIKIFGFSLGVSAVLFTGLAIGSLSPEFKLPEIIYRLGLILFVYTVGLSSGPCFFSSFKKKGLRDNFFILLMISFACLISLSFHYFFELKGTIISGIFSGSLTSTPALAGVLEYLKEHQVNNLNGTDINILLSEPVVGYSLTYPGGIIGMVLAINLLQKVWKIDYNKELTEIHEPGLSTDPLTSITIKVLNNNFTEKPVNKLIAENRWNIVFGRIVHSGKLGLVNGKTEFSKGDLVSVIGNETDLKVLSGELGEIIDRRLDLERNEFDFRRIFVSNRDLVGKKIGELGLNRFGAIITRVRRGDIDFIANNESILEPGDRVRIVAPINKMKKVGRFLGDSLNELSEVDLISFSLGIAIGLLIGIIPIPLFNGSTFKLGFAGGVLISGLVLGKLQRTRAFLWQIPYNANRTIRQLGMILFLAGIGTISGYNFVNTMSQGNGLSIFFAGAIITFTTAFLSLFIGYKILKIPMGILIGMLSGLQTQPAVLGFANEQAKNQMPNIGYSTVFPVAMIAKIIIAQLLIYYLGSY